MNNILLLKTQCSWKAISNNITKENIWILVNKISSDHFYKCCNNAISYYCEKNIKLSKSISYFKLNIPKYYIKIKALLTMDK